LDFKKQNEALLIKHLHKFFNKEDILWVSLVELLPRGRSACSKSMWFILVEGCDKVG
jgi:hypothetical protein